jgi:hypothetical protein
VTYAIPDDAPFAIRELFRALEQHGFVITGHLSGGMGGLQMTLHGSALDTGDFLPTTQIISFQRRCTIDGASITGCGRRGLPVSRNPHKNPTTRQNSAQFSEFEVIVEWPSDRGF